MKKLLIAMVVIFVGLNLVACSEKKDNRTRLTKGAARNSGAQGGQTNVSGWNILNAQSWEDVLSSSNPDAVAKAFIGEDADMGYVSVNSVAMRLRFVNGQIDPNSSYVGFRFYDNAAQPMSYLLEPQSAGFSGTRNGNQVSVVINDGGSIIIEGTISGNNFSGNVFFDGQNYMGSFNLPVSGSIFY